MSTQAMATAAVAAWERAPLPVELLADARIAARHLARHALISVRQSHPNQVQRHPESARRQYGLVERATQLTLDAKGAQVQHATFIVIQNF